MGLFKDGHVVVAETSGHIVASVGALQRQRSHAVTVDGGGVDGKENNHRQLIDSIEYRNQFISLTTTGIRTVKTPSRIISRIELIYR